MKRISPPAGVQARPVATPGSDVRLRTSCEKRRGPSHSRTRASSILSFVASPFAICVAALRKRVASWRSTLRTPASRVYSRITSRSARSWTVAIDAVRPCSRSCFGIRYLRAIPNFSSSL
jgi:hypothetical protein